MPSDHDDEEHSDSDDDEESPVCIGSGNDAATVDSMDMGEETEQAKDKGKGKASDVNLARLLVEIVR